uniref:Phytocyanin domain-containing protein n=1 Tax=Leersia perrieri TaxID=77586 RepID=A0A0D9WVW6_9ORYZ
MASRQVLLLAIVAVVALLPAMASAMDYTVGDGNGWTLKYPSNWADGKSFQIGDKLGIHTRTKGNHTVTEVDGPTFHACNRQGNTLNTYNSGNDTVALDKAGRRWFFCNVEDHCEKGMKLLVNVVDPNAPAPASPPPPPPSSSAGRLINYMAGGAVSQAMAAAAAGALAVTVLMLF